ncbi:MAG TPA: hypothetical protein V6D47_19695 [Oscillatoriaceae cyanobacterium]
MRRLVRLTAVCALLVGLGGCYQLSSAQHAAEQQAIQHETAANNSVKAEVLVTILALEEYAVDHEGVYPTTGALIAALSERYLPDGMMPGNPWVPTGLRQGNAVGVGALLAAAGHQPTPVGTVLGAGKTADSSRFDALTYGAVVYDYDTKNRDYVVYGIGRRGDQAIVSYVWTNAKP